MRRDMDLWRGEPSMLAPREFSRSPFRALRRMEREMNRLFDDFYRLPTTRAEAPEDVGFVPTCDVEETDQHYLISFDIPGIKKEDVNVEVCGNVLTVSGDRKKERKEEGEGRYFAEREYGTFCRSLTLPSDVKAENIEANYQDGVLQVAIPKAEEAKRQRIQIGEGKVGPKEKLTEKSKEKETKAA